MELEPRQSGIGQGLEQKQREYRSTRDEHGSTTFGLVSKRRVTEKNEAMRIDRTKLPEHLAQKEDKAKGYQHIEPRTRAIEER
jgi:hypothetical protein